MELAIFYTVINLAAAGLYPLILEHHRNKLINIVDNYLEIKHIVLITPLIIITLPAIVIDLIILKSINKLKPKTNN